MPAKCPECGTIVPESNHEQEFPSVVNPRGDKAITAKVSAYSCGCGRKFTTIHYEPGSASAGSAPSE